MKLLAFADLHADIPLLKKLIKRAQKDDIDVIICAGDFTVFGNGMKTVMKKLNTIKKPVLIVPGNHEQPEDVEKLMEEHGHLKSIHKKIWRHKGYTFCGWGTDGFSLKNADMRQTEREYRKQLTKDDNKIIFVTHAPAHKTKLDALHGDFVGNQDIRKAIERMKPKLHICGHIHENIGEQDKIGDTLTINPGWDGLAIDLD